MGELEGPNRSERLPAEDAVRFSRVEAARPERFLDLADGGAFHARRRQPVQHGRRCDLPGLRVSGVVDPRDQDAHVPAAAVERIADHAAVRRMRFHGAALAIRDDDVADDLAGKRDPQDCSPGGPRGSGDGDAVAKFPGVTRPVTRVRVR